MSEEKYVSDVPLKSIPVKRIGLKVRDSAITNPKIADGAITNEKIADDTIQGEKLADGAVTASKMADNSIPGSKLMDGTIDGAKITNNSLSGSKIQNGTITGSKIQDGAISKDKFAPEAIAEVDALTHDTRVAIEEASVATAGAEKVNASLDSQRLVLTVTNRAGQQTQANVQGASGVWYGTTTPPADYTVWIDPSIQEPSIDDMLKGRYKTVSVSNNITVTTESPAVGTETDVLYLNTASNTVYVTVSAQTYRTPTGENLVIEIPQGAYGEVNYTNINGVIYVRGA